MATDWAEEKRWTNCVYCVGGSVSTAGSSDYDNKNDFVPLLCSYQSYMDGYYKVCFRTWSLQKGSTDITTVSHCAPDKGQNITAQDTENEALIQWHC